VPRFPDWRNIYVQALVTGQIGRQTDGRLQAKFRLWDVLGGQQVDGKQYLTTPDNRRRIAHIVSDAIYERRPGRVRSCKRHAGLIETNLKESNVYSS
jgi:TolB protein